MGVLVYLIFARGSQGEMEGLEICLYIYIFVSFVH